MPATIKLPPQRSSCAWRNGNFAAASAAVAPSTTAINPRIRDTIASVCEISGAFIQRAGKDSVSPLFGALVVRLRMTS